MSQSESYEAQVTFRDAYSYFSEEDWKLLHEWQKDLYQSVMKELHRALVSLGPLIATTVSSLREKEKGELGPTDGGYHEERHRIQHSPRDAMASPEELFTTENLYHPQDAEGSERNEGFMAGFPFHLRKEEEPVSIFIDHLGAEIKESCTDPDSVHDAVSFRIKDEDEALCMNPVYSQRAESISSPTAGDGITIRKIKGGDAKKRTGKRPPYKTTLGKGKVKELHSPDKEAPLHSQLWSVITQEPGGDHTSKCESAFRDTEHFDSYQETQTSKIYNVGGSASFACRKDVEQSWRMYSCTECGKSFGQKEYLIKHKRIHMGVRPYQCTECEKSFIEKGNLVVHKRTHTGEKPYHCTICKKSFNQKGVLNRHQRTHAGINHYQCPECEKNFHQKRQLITHQKTHYKNKVSSPI